MVHNYNSLRCSRKENTEFKITRRAAKFSKSESESTKVKVKVKVKVRSKRFIYRIKDNLIQMHCVSYITFVIEYSSISTCITHLMRYEL